MKYFNSTKLLATCAALSAFSFASSASAATYNYAGANFQFTIDPYTVDLGLSGSITLADPLAANLVGANILADLVDWQFTDGRDVYTPLNATMDTFFNLDTDANGAIVDWDFQFSDENAPTTIEVYSANPNGDAVFFSDLNTGAGAIGITLNYGSWSTQPTATPVPLPASLPLLLAGLGVFAVTRKVRSS